MGLFNKIKGFFSEKKKENVSTNEIKKEINLDVSELNFWINKKIEENSNFLKESERNFFIKLEQIILRLEDASRVLKNFSVSEKKEDEKIKLVVEENRKIYIMFLDKLIVKFREIEEEKTGFKELLTKIQNDLNKFDEQTAKNRMKANFLIGREIEDVILELRNIIKLCREFNEENISKFTKADNLVNIKKTAGEVLERILQKEKLSAELRINNSKRDRVATDEKELLNKFESIKKGKDFAEYTKMEKEIENVRTLIKENSEKINQSINAKALERYIYDSDDNKFAKKYLGNPVEMLLEDDGLKISGILADVRKKIESGKIKMDKKKKEKMLAGIVFEKELFENLRNDRMSFIKKSMELKEEIKKKRNSIDLDDIERGIRNLSETKKEIESGIRNCQDKLKNEGKKVFEVVKDIENKINSSLDEKINVLLDT